MNVDVVDARLAWNQVQINACGRSYQDTFTVRLNPYSPPRARKNDILTCKNIYWYLSVDYSVYPRLSCGRVRWLCHHQFSLSWNALTTTTNSVIGRSFSGLAVTRQLIVTWKGAEYVPSLRGHFVPFRIIRVVCLSSIEDLCFKCTVWEVFNEWVFIVFVSY